MSSVKTTHVCNPRVKYMLILFVNYSPQKDILFVLQPKSNLLFTSLCYSELCVIESSVFCDHSSSVFFVISTNHEITKSKLFQDSGLEVKWFRNEDQMKEGRAVLEQLVILRIYVASRFESSVMESDWLRSPCNFVNK